MKKLALGTLIGASLLLSQQANAWWATGHALTAEVANEHINQTTKDQIVPLLNTEPSVPVIDSGRQPSPTPTVLYQTYNYIQGAATWPDDIKKYYWTSYSLKNNYSNMHFLDVDIDLSKQGSPSYCQSTLTIPYVKSFVEQNQINIVNALQSSIKTLTSNETSKAEKATALRYLVHLMGDLHQPLHASNPILDGVATYGGNLMDFEQNNMPSYAQVTGSNPLSDTTSLPFSELHAYFDGMLGEYNQLQETMDASYSPQGFELWSENKTNYLAYLQQLSQQLGNHIDHINPSILNWAQQTSLIACHILISKESDLHYSLSSNKKAIMVTFDPSTFEKYYPIINQQLDLGGMRLAYLLEAIYDPNSKDPTVIRYRNEIVNPIIKNQDIPTLAQLASS